MNIKILVCCHKNDVKVTNDPFFPIHVGKDLHPDLNLGIQTDNSGDNISRKNDCYCELTGLYWAWKNLKHVDIIGLSHYRRYFDFHNQCAKGKVFTSFPSSQIDRLNFTLPKNIIAQVNKGKIVTPRNRVCSNTVYYDYCEAHISDDIKALRYVINKTQPENIKKSFFKVFMQGNKILHYNMFIMKWSDFDLYCTWLFDILEKVESVTDITNYNSFQRRIYGYMSERLFLVWLIANNKDTIEKPVIWINDNKSMTEKTGYLRYMIRTIVNRVANWLSRPKTYCEEDMNNPNPYYIKKHAQN